MEVEAWKNVLDARYTLLVGGAPQPFRVNFERLRRKVDLYGRTRRGYWAKRIASVVSDGSLRAAAILCTSLDQAPVHWKELDNTTPVAFHTILRTLPAGVGLQDFVQLLYEEGIAYPCMVIDCQEQTKFLLYQDEALYDISVCCEDGVDALYTLFKIHAVDNIPFPEAVKSYYNFMEHYAASFSVGEHMVLPHVEALHKTLTTLTKGNLLPGL